MLQTTAIGHLGNDAILKEINGKKVMNFSVAHTEKYKNGEGVLLERTTWLECAYWTESTGIAPYLKRGVQVYVQGSASIETYQSKEGITKASFRIRVFNMQLLGSSKQDGQKESNGQGTVANHAPALNEMAEPVDDLPF